MVGQNRNSNNYWYRQQVVDRIHELYSMNNYQGISLPEIIINNNVDLVRSAITLFGTWENTLHKAGFEPVLVTKSHQLNSDYWSPEMVLDQIRSLYESKFDLSANFIRHVYPDLLSATMNKMNFGGWSNALTEAEVDYKYLRIPSRRFWGVQRIFQTLYDYDHAYGNLQAEFIKEINPSLYSGAHRYFKTWSETVTASGLNIARNLVKIMLEPLRTFILMDYITKIFELQGIDYRVTPVEEDTELGESRANMNEYVLPEIRELPMVQLELDENRIKTCITGAYRSWGFNTDKKIYELLSSYPRVTCYYCTGEPRQWVDDKVRFINMDQFYPELAERGRDDMISDLSLQARGGIPEKFQTQYNQVMRLIKEKVKKKRVKNSQ